MSKHHSKCTTCRHPCATDEDARFEISEDFRRFNQREDIFSRSFWDSTIRSKDTDKFYQSYRLPLEEWGTACSAITTATPHRSLCLLFIHPRAPNLISLRPAGTMPA